MNIRELSFEEFHNFASNHVLGSFYQSLNYALLKAEQGYEYEFVGYCENTNILAAAMILYKKINNVYYGYAPRGFLIDYTNEAFLKTFTEQIVRYYRERDFAFIKINPEIAIGQLNKKTKNFEYNANYSIIDILVRCGYTKLKSNLNFEALLPRFNAILPLEGFNIDKLSKNTRNKVKKGIRKGLVLELADKFGIDIFYDLIKDKISKDANYYKDEFNIFNKDDSIDLFLVSIDFKRYMLNAQKIYNDELNNNAILNEKIANDNSAKLINAKMNSDRAILAYKNDIAEATKFINSDEKLYLAGALVIKYDNRISIEVTGFDKEYKRYVPNYFLHFAILNYYKDHFKYANLNGVSGDLQNEDYKGLNRFKFGFNPDIYEYIGEFDLVIDEKMYTFLAKNGYLAKEFNKRD